MKQRKENVSRILEDEGKCMADKTKVFSKRDKNVDYMNQMLPVEDSFDIVQRDIQIGGKDGMKEVFKRGTFEKLIDVPFEDMVVPIPENYDLFLTQFYGDYMQKPSDEEIAYKSHLLKAYWKK